MRWKGFSFMFFTSLAVLLTAAAIVYAGSETSAVRSSDFGWKLQNARVINPGTTVNAAEGLLVTDYTVEASAAAQGTGAPVQTGIFRATLTIFSPANEMTGQKPGVWYVTGNWSITDSAASQNDLKSRHSRFQVNGTIKAELPFNPAAQAGSFDANVNIRMSPSTGGRSLKEGRFTGNERLEGDMLFSRSK